MSLTQAVHGNGTGVAAVLASRELAAGTSLAARLAAALVEAPVRHCQWKGAWKAERWSAGDGDIDLLVDRTARSRFESILAALGFRAAAADPAHAMPGVTSWFALDPAADRLIHVHAYSQLYVGRPWSTHYRLPIERAVLDLATPGAWFSVPAVEFELVLLVLHGTLRHGAGDVLRPGDAEWLSALRMQVERLGGETDPYVVADLVAEHLPQIGLACFDRCRAALTASDRWHRLVARRELSWRLRAFARRPGGGAWRRAFETRLPSFAGKRALPRGRKRLMTGGAVIALAGTDGAGKSTCAQDLLHWLSAALRVRHAHLGRPPRRLGTLLAGAALQTTRWFDQRRGRTTPSTLTAHLELLRRVGLAADRYALHRRVWRFAADGGLAICERYPLPEEHALVGPSALQGVATRVRGRVAALLRRREAAYYARLAPPDLVVVLRVSPTTAVRRKTDEPPAYVLGRANGSMAIDWSGCDAVVIDAERPLPEVVTDVRRVVWEAL